MRHVSHASAAPALHPRLQARRMLRQYADLVAHPRNSGPDEMHAARRPALATLAARPPAPDRMGWPVAVAVAFLVIHVVAGTIWLRASATKTTTSRQEAQQWQNPFIQETNRSAGIIPATDPASLASLYDR